MDRSSRYPLFTVLSSVFIAAQVLSSASTAMASAGDCATGSSIWTGSCSNDGRTITVESTSEVDLPRGPYDKTPSWESPSESIAEPSGSGQELFEDDREAAPQLPARNDIRADLAECLRKWEDARRCFTAGAKNPVPDAEAPADTTAPGEPAAAPTITARDLVRFAPAGVPLSAEPAGVAVAGLPANIVDGAGTETVQGALLGRPLSVRFTPIAFSFDYGDGARAVTDTGGASWAALGQAPFTETATSHVYATRGVYTATAVVGYAAEIDLGGGWQEVAGIVEGPPSTLVIRVYAARTALVARTCAEAPAGPGC